MLRSALAALHLRREISRPPRFHDFRNRRPFPFTRSDWIYGGYRDPGISLVRGVPLKALVDQLMANADDPSKGRQMGVHWGYKEWNVVSLSSPVACRMSQAVGTAKGLPNFSW